MQIFRRIWGKGTTQGMPKKCTGFNKLKKYCCPVNFQTAQESSPKPFRIGLRGFIFKK